MTKRCRRCKHFLGGNKAFCRKCKRIINAAKRVLLSSDKREAEGIATMQIQQEDNVRRAQKILGKIAEQEKPKPFFSKAVANAKAKLPEIISDQIREVYQGKKQTCDLCGESAHLKKHKITDREPKDAKELELCAECWDWWHKKVTSTHKWVVEVPA